MADKSNPLVNFIIKQAVSSKFPGPGTYNYMKEFGKNKNGVEVRSRLMYFYGNSKIETRYRFGS